MQLVVGPLGVQKGDGFKNDLLGRESFGVALTNITTTVSSELVLSINGRWGEGKTTFVKMWRDMLATRAVPSIYIDAFSSEFNGEPFLTLASEIQRFMEDECEGGIALRGYAEKAKAVGVGLLCWTGKIAIKALTLGMIGSSEIDELSEVKEDIADTAAKKLGSLVRRELEGHADRLQELKNFREQLSEIPANIPGNSSGKLIVVIDELDRCCPSFAVMFLERIKHIFSVPNVVFVLVLNKQQLHEAIRAVYGAGVDAHAYLQKFINLEAELPSKSTVKGLGRHRFVQYLHQQHGLDKLQRSQEIFNSILATVEYFGLSLREIEKAYTNLTLYYASRKAFVIEPLLALLCVLKVVRPLVFQTISKGGVNYKRILAELDIDTSTINRAGRSVYVALKWIQYSLMPESEFNALGKDDELRSYPQTLFNYAIEAKEIISWHIETLVSFNTEGGA